MGWHTIMLSPIFQKRNMKILNGAKGSLRRVGWATVLQVLALTAPTHKLLCGGIQKWISCVFAFAPDRVFWRNGPTPKVWLNAGVFLPHVEPDRPEGSTAEGRRRSRGAQIK